VRIAHSLDQLADLGDRAGAVGAGAGHLVRGSWLGWCASLGSGGGRRRRRRRWHLELGGVDRLGVQPVQLLEEDLGLALELRDVPAHQHQVPGLKGGLDRVHVVEDASVHLAGPVAETHDQKDLSAAGGGTRLPGDLEHGLDRLLVAKVAHVHLAHHLVALGCLAGVNVGRSHGTADPTRPVRPRGPTSKESSG